MLEELGVEADQELVYEHVVRRPHVTVEELAGQLAISRDDLATALAGLVDLGLIVRVPGSADRWSAVPPDVAIEALIRRREERLDRLRHVGRHFLAAYQQGHGYADGHEVVEVLTGPAAIRQRWDQLQFGARQEVCGFDRPPYLNAVNEVEPVVLRTGVTYRVVYERACFELPGRLVEIRRCVAAGEIARVVPHLPLKVAIVDRRWALLPVASGSRELDRALVVRPSALLDALIAMFELHWSRALPLPGYGRIGEDVNAELLAMLLAGMTDEAIARRLGIGLRTTQRRIRGLIDELGVETRFQAGVQAVRTGLLADPDAVLG